MELAQQLIDGLTNDEFKPEQYADEYRQRVLDVINRKVEGQEVTIAAPAPPRAQVVDLMEALKESLAKRKPPAKVAAKRAEPARAEPVRAARRAQGKK
jgi:DNA end-binding protein Ku